MLDAAKRAFILAWLAIGALVLGAAQPLKVQTLTTCNAVSRWTPTKDQPTNPVHVRAVVTYFDAVGRTMFVEDKTGGVFVHITTDAAQTTAGQLVDLEGHSELIDFSPQITAAHWKVISNSGLPEPRRVTYQQMASASVDSELIQVDGVLREIDHIKQAGEQNTLWMKMAVDGGQLDIYMPWVGVWPSNLVDAKVRVEGVSGADFNAKNQQVGVQLYVANLSQIKVINDGPPFNPMPAPINLLQRFGSPYSLGQRVKVAGIVTGAIKGRGFYLQDASSGLYVLTRQDIALHPGDRVETMGYVEVFEKHVRLADAAATKVASGDQPLPVPMQLSQAMNGEWDSKLVSLEGSVVQSSVSAVRTTMTLRQNHDLFSISSLPGTSLGKLPAEGSIVRVTGILTDEIDSMGRVVQANLLCRSSKDLTLLQIAPWWTLQKALALLGFLSAIAAVILMWVVVLRRRVNNQTNLIRQKLVQEESLKEAAQAASRAKSEFLANMSHEIRTPMNAIVGFTDLLSETFLDAEQKDFTDTLRSSSQSLMHLLNEILDFSKIEAGQLFLEEVPFSIRERAKQAFGLMIHQAQQKELTTLLEISPDVTDLLIGDPHRLQQVLLNLLSNAIKFTSRGSVTLLVSCVSRDDLNTVLKFTVRDSGIGIPLDCQDKIFEAFQQADGSMTRRYGGTGLGLAICTRLIALFGGTIWLESTPGSGSTFYFTANFRLVQVDAARLSDPRPESALSMISKP